MYKRQIYECIIDRANVQDAILDTEIDSLKVISSHINLVGAEIEMLNLPNREKILKEVLTPLKEEYDYILIDCSPSLGLITINAVSYTHLTAVNRRHQQHFEALKETEQHNLDQKTVICEIVEAIEYNELKTFSAWENKTQEVIALQNKWKTIGFAPQKMNVKIFERFRHACDDFFKKKGEFFKSLKEGMNENLEKKKALCENCLLYTSCVKKS